MWLYHFLSTFSGMQLEIGSSLFLIWGGFALEGLHLSNVAMIALLAAVSVLRTKG